MCLPCVLWRTSDCVLSYKNLKQSIMCQIYSGRPPYVKPSNDLIDQKYLNIKTLIHQTPKCLGFESTKKSCTNKNLKNKSRATRWEIFCRPEFCWLGSCGPFRFGLIWRPKGEHLRLSFILIITSNYRMKPTSLLTYPHILTSCWRYVNTAARMKFWLPRSTTQKKSVSKINSTASLP